MMLESDCISIEVSPATFKSFVCQHFGYPVEIIHGNRMTDERQTICTISTVQLHFHHQYGSVQFATLGNRMLIAVCVSTGDRTITYVSSVTSQNHDTVYPNGET